MPKRYEIVWYGFSTKEAAIRFRRNNGGRYCHMGYLKPLYLRAVRAGLDPDVYPFAVVDYVLADEPVFG